MIVWPSTIENSNTKNLKFKSAKGCYSQAVIRRNDVRVKWAVKAFTDVGEGGPVYAQGVHLSLGSPPPLTSSRAYAPATPEDGERLLELSSNWFEDVKKHPKYSEAGLSIQKLVGERSRVETYHTLYEKNGDETLTDVKCMYWAPKTYQMDICTVDGDVGVDEIGLTYVYDCSKFLGLTFYVNDVVQSHSFVFGRFAASVEHPSQSSQSHCTRSFTKSDASHSPSFPFEARIRFLTAF